MYRRPSFILSVIFIILMLFVLSAFLAFFIKLAFLALVLAAAYYLFARATHSLTNRRRPPKDRHHW